MKHQHRSVLLFRQFPPLASLLCAALLTCSSKAADRDRVEDGDYTKTVTIVFSGTTATVTDGAGVTVTYGSSTSAIAITSTLEGVEYILSGSTTSGHFQLTSTFESKITLNGVSVTSTTGPAISTFSTARSFIVLPSGTANTLTDGSTYIRTGSGTIHTNGPLIFSGKGSLSVTGVKSHAIYGSTYIRCLGGDITVPASAKDAIHSKTLFQMDHGTLGLTPTGDGIDGDSGTVILNGGTIAIRSTVDDTKGIVSDGALTINGGSISITVNGAQSKAISTKSALTVNAGVLALHLTGAVVLETITGTTNADPSYCTALKCDGNLTVNGGAIAITHTGTAGKGFSSDGDITINAGLVDITTTGGPSATYTNESSVTDEASSDCISADGNVTLAGGTVILHTDGIAADSISADLAVIINAGTLDITTKGNRSKGIKSDTSVTFNGGTSTFTLSGGVVLQSTTVTNRYAPSYCTAVKSDDAVSITGGTINVTHTGQAGKGISADGNITITGGTTTISTSGANTTSYYNTSNTLDMAAADCLKADGNLTITGGTLTATSTGAGADAISCEGTALIGTLGNDTSPVITASTSGANVLLSGSGMNADYVNAKVFKAEGNITINGGIYRATSAASEGLESKGSVTINGGLIEITSYDDCINATKRITVTGGTIYCYSSNNDGIDSNAASTTGGVPNDTIGFSFTGGIIISSGSNSPEEGFDCDNSTFAITGGTLIGSGGATSTPSTSSTYQSTIVYSAASVTAGTYIALMPNATTLPTTAATLVYKVPRAYTGNSSRPMTLVLSSSAIAKSTSYKIITGVSVSGGTEFGGYRTGATVSGGASTRTFTTSSGNLTTVQQ